MTDEQLASLQKPLDGVRNSIDALNDTLLSGLSVLLGEFLAAKQEKYVPQALDTAEHASIRADALQKILDGIKEQPSARERQEE